jgi:hypothetical protein
MNVEHLVGNRSTRRKPAPVPLCPPQMPHDLTWTRTGKPATNRLSYGTATDTTLVALLTVSSGYGGGEGHAVAWLF